jgi:putative transposase
VRGLTPPAHGHFEVTDEIRHRLAFWRGNAAAVHRELVEAAKTGGAAAPSLSTLQRGGGPRSAARGPGGPGGW